MAPRSGDRIVANVMEMNVPQCFVRMGLSLHSGGGLVGLVANDDHVFIFGWTAWQEFGLINLEDSVMLLEISLTTEFVAMWAQRRLSFHKFQGF